MYKKYLDNKWVDIDEEEYKILMSSREEGVKLSKLNTRNGHYYLTKDDGNDKYEGLNICIICGGAEGSLTSECCGNKLSYETQEIIFKQQLDFRYNMWVTLQDEDTRPKTLKDVINNYNRLLSQSQTLEPNNELRIRMIQKEKVMEMRQMYDYLYNSN